MWIRFLKISHFWAVLFWAARWVGPETLYSFDSPIDKLSIEYRVCMLIRRGWRDMGLQSWDFFDETDFSEIRKVLFCQKRFLADFGAVYKLQRGELEAVIMRVWKPIPCAIDWIYGCRGVLKACSRYGRPKMDPNRDYFIYLFYSDPHLFCFLLLFLFSSKISTIRSSKELFLCNTNLFLIQWQLFFLVCYFFLWSVKQILRY